MTLLRRLLLPVMACALLAGCATTGQSPALFLLAQPAPPAAVTPANTAQTQLVLQQVTLAAYLAQQGIVYQTDAHRVTIADNNRWATPLADQITVSLYRTLQTRLPGVVVSRARLATTSADYKLRVHIEQFQGRANGTATVAGTWRLTDHNGHLAGRSHFSQTAKLAHDGYPALVAALDKAWQQARQRITRAVQKALSASRSQAGAHAQTG